MKAMDIAYIEKDSLVIGADTIVVRDHAILGKPGDRKDSFSMLSSLSGRTHTVITGVSIQHVSQNVDHTFTDETHVTFKELSKEEIDYYIDRYKPFDKAGSYGIQDWFSVCVDKVEGCFYNVVGFPLAAFYREVSSLYNLS